MNVEIIKRLKLKRANFGLEQPYDDLIIYSNKKGIFMADSGRSDELILIYKIGGSEYSCLSAEYLLTASIKDINEGLKQVDCD